MHLDLVQTFHRAGGSCEFPQISNYGHIMRSVKRCSMETRLGRCAFCTNSRFAFLAFHIVSFLFICTLIWWKQSTELEEAAARLACHVEGLVDSTALCCVFLLLCAGCQQWWGGKVEGGRADTKAGPQSWRREQKLKLYCGSLCCRIGRKLTDLTRNLCCNCLIPRPHSIALQMMEWDLGMRLCINLSYVNILKHAIADCYILYCTVEDDFFFRSLN